MLDKFKKLNNPKFYTLLIFVFLIIQPIVDLDYLLNLIKIKGNLFG